ncbi:MAG: bifunctional diaminohydroxyphosphoribosylaminopyrimidine deaminase/5-amino-6-(5-phosphoribosylamino)uracil reductase RibD [Planctomycetes bacterium]|nr:bifunctional diaminohydroxyphosphoribosylaminopyrimidine deaminase/5-amino-6-(5-phosphoribosylamino)uracil reductase RibD [Planctomycetota bacterium]
MRATQTALDETLLTTLFESLGQEAHAQRFEVAPNPCVGAAVLAGDRVLSRGFHRVWGGPHAEVEALALAAESGVPQDEWTTLAVTLEPCSSVGKQPACTEAILRSGIRRVIVGAVDPDPRSRGAGIQRLREAGLQVDLFEGVSTLDRVTPHFVQWTSPDRMRRPRPWTIAKWAQTRSGHLIPPAEVGGGRWISGPASLDEVHVLRGRVDAIVTGISTVLADDPRFSVRPPGDPSKPPIRVVLDSVLRTPPNARLFQPKEPHEGLGGLHILYQAGTNAERYRLLEAAGAKLVGLHVDDNDHVSLWDVQAYLWQLGVRRVLLESGPILLSRYLDHGFVDQVRVYTGNVSGGRGETLGPRLAQMRFEERADRETGGDAVLEAFLYD